MERTCETCEPVTEALDSRLWRSKKQTTLQSRTVVCAYSPETSDTFYCQCCSLKLALLSLFTDYQVHWELIQGNKLAVCKWAAALGLRPFPFTLSDVHLTWEPYSVCFRKLGVLGLTFRPFYYSIFLVCLRA